MKSASMEKLRTRLKGLIKSNLRGRKRSEKYLMKFIYEVVRLEQKVKTSPLRFHSEFGVNFERFICFLTGKARF